MHDHSLPRSKTNFKPGDLQAIIGLHEGIIRGLGARGAQFIVQDRGTKGSSGLRYGYNEPDNTLDTEQAIRAYRRGKNIGLAAGSGDVYCFDFDGDAERGHECPQLGGTIYTYRENALDRAKIFFTCSGRLPKKAEAEKVGLQGWASTGNHTNAVIAGWHDSGAPILWSGHQLVDLHPDSAEALWTEWTGRDLHGPDPDALALDVDPDADGEDLLAAAIDQASVGSRNKIGFVLGLRMNDRRIAFDDATGYMTQYQQAVTAQADPYTISEAMASLRSAYTRPPRAQTPTAAELVDFHRNVLYTQAWLRTADAADLMKEAGVRLTTTRRALTALLDIEAEWGRDAVWPGLRRWALRAGVTVRTLTNNIPKWESAGFLERIPAEDDGSADIYQVVLQKYHSSQEVGATRPADARMQGGVVISQFYSEHRSDDAFRDAHAAYRKAKPEALDPLGCSNLDVWAALMGGCETVGEISDETGIGEATVRRMLNRDIDHGLVTYTSGRHNLRRYNLIDDAEGRLDVLRPQMNTYGVTLRRSLQDAEKRLIWALENEGRVSPARMKTLMDDFRRYASAAGWQGPDPVRFVKRTRKVWRWIRWDTAERDAELAQLRDEVQRLRLAGTPTHEIRRWLEFGGYAVQDVLEVLYRSDPLAEMTPVSDQALDEIAEFCALDKAEVQHPNEGRRRLQGPDTTCRT